MNNAADQNNPAIPAIVLDEIPHPTTGALIRLQLLVPVAVSLYRTAREVGIQAVDHLIYLTLALRDGSVSTDELDSFYHTAAVIVNTLEANWQDSEDILLESCYTMLHHKLMTPKQAAEFAARVLSKSDADNKWKNAFRMRINRWAEKRDLPKVGIRTRSTADVHSS